MHSLSANIVDSIIKYSLVKLSGDNVTCIFISFKNFKDKMEDEDFEYNENSLGFQIPYRILPGRLAVSKFLLFYFYMYLGRKSFWRYKF